MKLDHDEWLPFQALEAVAVIAGKPNFKALGHCNHWEVAGFFERADEMKPATVVVTSRSNWSVVVNLAILTWVDTQRFQ